MATVQKVIDINASANDVWNKIANIGSVSDIIGFITESEYDGDVRVCKMADGGVLEEKIISIDDSLRRVAYSIINSPLDLEFHSASMQVVSKDKGATMVWTTDLKPDALAQQFDSVLEEAVPGMRTALESN